MKKLHLWLLASLFVAAFTLTACGDDDDEPANQNQQSSTWKCTKSYSQSEYDILTLTLGKDNSCTMVHELWNGEQLHVRWIYQGKYIINSDAEATVTVEKTFGQNPEDPEPWDTGNPQETFKVKYRRDGNQLYIIGMIITGQSFPEGPYIKQ